MNNIPLVNLRQEFELNLKIIRDPKFETALSDTTKSYQVAYLVWHGMPGALLSLLLQRAILGIEAYLPAAALAESALRNTFRRENQRHFQNPYTLGGRGTAENYYNRLPELVSEGLSLRSTNESLWDLTKQFYTEIRNPLFHGYELKEDGLEGAKRSYEHIADLYNWIDSWHSMQEVWDKAFSK